ncbi:helix-turn-helix domain-containing protein [Saccharothrix isguenensis]
MTLHPTLQARLLGHEMRRIREASGLTVTELAARSGHCPSYIQRLEDGITDAPAPEPTLWCHWDTTATSLINVLCRLADRIDIYAPLGIHPALGNLAADRCTAYVLDGTTVDRADVTVRRITHTAHPGAEHPLTRFTLPHGPAVVLYTYLHGAHFTEEPDHLRSAYALFEALAGISRPVS